MVKKILLFVIILRAATLPAGLIKSGLDTIGYLRDGGFDFYLERPCSTALDIQKGCYPHIVLAWDELPNRSYALVSSDIAGLCLGKINIDSVKEAPPINEMVTKTNRVFSIRPDSLNSCIGNVYVFLTGDDPRLQNPFYAKIKILDFKVHDPATHKTDMVFLWAYNMDNRRDLQTYGLDTLKLDTPVHVSHYSSGKGSYVPRQPFAYKLVAGRFIVPQELARTGAVLGFYDFQGKLLGKVTVREERIIDVKRITGGRGAVVVRGE